MRAQPSLQVLDFSLEVPDLSLEQLDSPSNNIGPSSQIVSTVGKVSQVVVGVRIQ
jgi:hypothetical protein